ncbi:arylamine N-acetyltransferase family protein [Fuscibacter oryzae]|uniref:Arylamine N-acetyltransferase n=1 Tax=Fuscibacter oryzae TaxID=2803939 RepID=A0A8J7MRD8_9RHOB|nr:arylamine N-acetyltransferase [Fuscibacter oryzae]MBL4928513.1 arylamine N-acetyltransferase [Fuscibacter oryzae]
MSKITSKDDSATLTDVQLDAYLARIGLDRPRALDLQSLKELHRAHLMAFTWEALDAFMNWPSGVSPQAAFTKMVDGRRGGWCYEMNGLFGAALSALGFSVTRLCGGVNRAILGDVAIGNHLGLRVDIDLPYLAEVGIGDAIVEPVPMMESQFSQRGLEFSITRSGDGWMRFNNHALGVARSMDFRPDHTDEKAIAAAHGWLMTDAGSPFTQALAVMRHTNDGYVALQNHSLRHVTNVSFSEKSITSADHLAEILETVFDLEIADPGRVWDRVCSIDRERAA